MFLVLCCLFCSLSTTEDLAGLPQNLFPDWLMRREHTFLSTPDKDDEKSVMEDEEEKEKKP